jgi:hypothetical protein
MAEQKGKQAARPQAAATAVRSESIDPNLAFNGMCRNAPRLNNCERRDEPNDDGRMP